MRRVVQRRLTFLAGLAALGVGFAAFRVMSAPTRDAVVGDEGAAPHSEWQPPPLVPADGAAEPRADVASEALPKPTPREALTPQFIATPQQFHLRGRLVGLVPTSPWKAPVFVRFRFDEADEFSSRHSTIALHTPRRRREDFQLPVEARLERERAEVLAPWDPVTEASPGFERMTLVDARGNRVAPPS